MRNPPPGQNTALHMALQILVLLQDQILAMRQLEEALGGYMAQTQTQQLAVVEQRQGPQVNKTQNIKIKQQDVDFPIYNLFSAVSLLLIQVCLFSVSFPLSCPIRLSFFSGQLQYSPAVLQQRMAAELQYLESIEESVRHLGDVERLMGVSMAQQESVSLAQMLKV